MYSPSSGTCGVVTITALAMFMGSQATRRDACSPMFPLPAHSTPQYMHAISSLFFKLLFLLQFSWYWGSPFLLPKFLPLPSVFPSSLKMDPSCCHWRASGQRRRLPIILFWAHPCGACWGLTSLSLPMILGLFSLEFTHRNSSKAHSKRILWKRTYIWLSGFFLSQNKLIS